jgi:hypothetical protein
MIQFYFFSVLLNVLGGYALYSEGTPPRGSAFDGLRAFLRDPTARLVLGILAAVTGAFKLLAVVRGDIPVVGDFLPALAGMAVGTTLILDSSGRAPAGSGSAAPTGSATGDEGRGDPVPRRRGGAELFLLANREAIGIAGMIAGLVHFLFPMVIFL